MATIVTRSGKGSPLTHAEVDSNFTNLNTDKLELSGGTMTGNLSFGDNDKAIFGAGSDLQIYSDGSSSYIKESGSGNLVLNAGGLRVNSPNNTETLLKADVNGAVQLRYDNSPKLDTTSTGIDVTGTVTADGLNVDGEGIVSSTTTATDLSNPILQLSGSSYTANGVYGIGFHYDTDASGTSPVFAGYQLTAGGGNTKGNLVFGTRDTTTAGDVPLIRQTIASNGDISFYEDTGTTAKFFWDASAESLGIGTSSPSGKFVVSDNGGMGLEVFVNSSASNIIQSYNRSTTSWATQRYRANDHIFESNGASERMRIDSSGNVGIGTSSPDRALHVNTSQDYVAKFSSSDAGAAILLEDSNSTANYNRIGVITHDMQFVTNNSEAMRIDSSGNLIVGATSAVGDIHGQRSDGAMLWLGRTTNSGQTTALLGEIRFGDTAFDSNLAAIQSNLDGSTTSSNLRFYTQATSAASAERMRIDSSGNVGIGTSSPAAKLDVRSTGGTYTGGLLLQSVSSGNFGTVFTDSSNMYLGTAGSHIFASYDGSSERMRIDSSGNVGIGTSSPDARLHIEGQASGSEYAALKLSNNVNADGSGVSLEFADVVDLTTTKITSLRTGTSYSLQFFTTSSSTLSEKMRITGGGNVGIGTSSPLQALHVNSGTGNSAAIFESTDATSQIWLKDSASSSTYQTGIACYGDNLLLNNGGERMRIDSSGNLLVGKTAANTNTTGVQLIPNGLTAFTRDGDHTVRFNRLTSDGDVVIFQKDGTTVGSIGTYNSYLYIGEGDVGLAFRGFSDYILPWNPSTNSTRDNAIDIGNISYRFDDIYATNGTIQTSDQNEKQDIAELSEAEQRVAVAAKGLLRKFRWKDAVAEKGDEARTHFGIIAQDLQAAFAAEGLDAGDYAMFIHSTWTDEETGEERSRMGVRYSELLAFIIAAI